MVKTELTKSVASVKNPYIQIIIYGSIIIIGALAGAIVYQNRTSGDVQKKTYDAVVETNRAKDSIIDKLNNKIDDLNDRQYQYVMQQYESERQKNENEKQKTEVKFIIDSLSTEVIKLTQKLNKLK